MHVRIPRQYRRRFWPLLSYQTIPSENFLTGTHDYAFVPKLFEEREINSFFWEYRRGRSSQGDVVHAKLVGELGPMEFSSFKIGDDLYSHEGVCQRVVSGASYRSLVRWRSMMVEDIPVLYYITLDPSNGWYWSGLQRWCFMNFQVGVFYFDPSSSVLQHRAVTTSYGGGSVTDGYVTYNPSIWCNEVVAQIFEVLMNNEKLTLFVRENITNWSTEANVAIKSVNSANSYLASLAKYLILNRDNSTEQMLRESFGTGYSTFSGDPLLPDVTDLQDAFLLHEVEQIRDGLPAGVFYHDTSGYWTEYMKQHAYLDALEHMPRLNDNSISNILEICSFLYNLIHRRKIEIPNSWGQAWLQYRYQFSTGKLDLEEGIKFFKRKADLGSLNRRLRIHGQSVIDYGGIQMMCRCSATIRPKIVDWIDQLSRELFVHGLSPTLYVIWDMIPFSFIADWFLPIGDTLSVMDASHSYSSIYYDIKDVVYSISYVNNGIKLYSRWLGGTPPELHSFYWFENSGVGGKTICKRILDAASLLVG